MKPIIRRGIAIAGSVALAAAMAVAIPAGANAAPSGPSGHAIPKSAPSWLAKAHHTGWASSGGTVSFQVYLQPRGGAAALEGAAASVSTPGSASYGTFLSAQQYHKAFDPTPQTVAAVRAWLQSRGLHVQSVAEHNVYLQVGGTVAQAQGAFSTTIGTYAHDGQTVQANATPLIVPEVMAGSVLTVTGIDTTQSYATVQNVPPPPAGFNNARPCSLHYGQLKAKVQADLTTPLPKFNGKYLPYAICGYTGPQLRAAYEGGSALDGSGVTVGIVDAYASPTLAADAQTYAETNGDGSYSRGQLKQTNANNFTHINACGASGWYGEQSLDVEAVHAMAPGANIHYYGAASCENSDLLAALRTVVNQDKVDIVTNSWGEPEDGETTGGLQAFHAIFLQAAVEGISVMFSSGDNGDELANTGIKQADSSASDPAVTAVGGTATGIGGDGSMIFQSGWGTEKYSLSSPGGRSWNPVGYLYGSGGGYSALFNRPTYQNGVVPASAPPGRAVPDVAMDADPTTGMLIGQTQTFPDGVHYGQYRIGGTSLASPLLAGMTALAIQSAGRRLGLLNPALYAAAGTGVFTDVKGTPPDAGNVRVDYANGIDPSNGLLYSVRTFNQDSSLSIARGWDDVTGIGVPNASWLTSFGS